jgi:hypothetical protein
MHAPVQWLLNALAYFATAISYTSKMFTKSTPEVNVINLFMAVSYEFL